MKIFTILLILIFTSFSSNAQVDKLTKSLNAYSLDLYSQVKSDKESLFISPLSTYYALLIAYEGAKNNTKKEFEQVLHIGSSDYLTNFKEYSKSFTSWKDTSNYLNISNALWLQQDFAFKENYKNNIKNIYSADLRTVDFKQNVSAANDINKWVTNKTNGRIKDIISPFQIDKDTRLIIANAIYFIGKWAIKFDKNLTKPADFYAINKKSVEVDFMNKLDFIQFYEDNDIQVISKEYEGNDKSFCIILPKERYNLPDVEKTFDNTRLETIVNTMKYARVNLSFPKLKLETSYSLTGPLKKLGLKKAFTNRADFSGISSEDPLMINEITHKAFLQMDEEKTEAAAATVNSIRIRGTSPMAEPKIFKADHPFTFMIIDNKTKGILFIGRYVQPN